MKSMITRLLEIDGKRPQLHEVMTAASDKVNIKKVAERLILKSLPPDVKSIVSHVALQGNDNKKAKDSAPFDESSLGKARRVLNEMSEQVIHSLYLRAHQWFARAACGNECVTYGSRYKHHVLLLPHLHISPQVMSPSPYS